jgi:hypothetical protein
LSHLAESITDAKAPDERQSIDTAHRLLGIEGPSEISEEFQYEIQIPLEI